MTLDINQLARLGAQRRIEEIRAEIAAIQKAYGLEVPLPRAKRAGPAGRKRGGMSAAARRAASERMRRHWAGRRAEKAAAKPAKPASGGRKRRRGKLSAAGRAAIVAAQKARWARFRAGK